ncbi:hypothetical protein OC844_002069 [Tilletia horrida]|nr:hypothetical protein OC844_002069 [Tilletia horrida]
MERPRRFVACGGHSGLGLATLEHLFRPGFDAIQADPARVARSLPLPPPIHLILLVRDPNATHARDARSRLAALAAQLDPSGSSRIELRTMDLADIKSIRAAAALLLQEDVRIDTLWLNAAVAKAKRELVLDNSADTPVTYEHTALVNHVGPLLLLDLLMPLLLDRPTPDHAKSRIVFTGSALHRTISRDRPADETLFADFNSSALPNGDRYRDCSVTPASQIGNTPAWSLRSSYAHSKFLQVLGVRKFLRQLEFALAQRASLSEGSDGQGRTWNEMEVVLVQPGFIPTTGLTREASLPTRILTTYLLPNMPGTSSFVSTLQQGAEVLAAALSWPLQLRQEAEAVDMDQPGFPIEQQRADLAPADGWLGGPSISSAPIRALVVKGKVLQRPDERTDDEDLQDRWWPVLLCRSAWISPSAGQSRQESEPEGGQDDAEAPYGDEDVDGSVRRSDAQGDGKREGSSTRGISANPTQSGPGLCDLEDLTASSGTSRSRRLTVSQAATALHGLALSGSIELDRADFELADNPASLSFPSISSQAAGLSIDTSGNALGAKANSERQDQPPPKTPDMLNRTIPLAPEAHAAAAAMSLPSRTPPRRQASSPLSLYSTSADMLSVRRASASALQLQTQRVHAPGVIPAMSQSALQVGADEDDDAAEELLDHGHHIPFRTGSSSLPRPSAGTSSSRCLSFSPSPRRPSGPASNMWGGMGLSSSPPAMPTPFSRRLRSGNSSAQQAPFTSPGPAMGAWSPSTASYTQSPISRHPPSSFSFSQSHTRSASLSLIGSYDESLLSGRMSTMPSQPFDFDAELGVLGMGSHGRQCPRKLRCPKHLSLGFEARYYPLGGGAEATTAAAAHGGSEEHPGGVHQALWSPSPSMSKLKMISSLGSPYVGSIDLERYFLSRLERLVTSAQHFDGIEGAKIDGAAPLTPSAALAEVPAFPGYQVPPKGQIQLIVKNQNLTAVKVFLVKYDLSDMQPGTKTFIRQKSYVCTDAGVAAAATTLTATAASATSATGRGRQSSAGGGGGEKEKETMRYAVHLQFACPPLATPKPATAEQPYIAATRDAPVPMPMLVPTTDTASDQVGTTKTQKGGTTPSAPQPKIYLHRHIRVVFAAMGLDSFERLDVVTETPGGVIRAGTGTGSTAQKEGPREHVYSAYAGPPDAWRRARRNVRRKLMAMKEEAEASARRAREAVDVEADAASLTQPELPSGAEVSFDIGTELVLDDRQDRGTSETTPPAMALSAAPAAAPSLDSSVHSAFGIPAPRSRSRRSMVLALGRGGSEDGSSSSSEHAHVVGREARLSSEQVNPSAEGILAGASAGEGAEGRASSPASTSASRAFVPMHRRRTLSRGGSAVPYTVDENSAVALTATTTTPAATTADQELLDSWHRSLRRLSLSTSGSSAGHGAYGPEAGVGLGLGFVAGGNGGPSAAGMMSMSNASIIGAGTGSSSRPGSPLQTPANAPAPPLPMWRSASRPTSPELLGPVLPPVLEMRASDSSSPSDSVNHHGGCQIPQVHGPTTLLSQLQAQHSFQQAQLQSLTAAFARPGSASGGGVRRLRSSSSSLGKSITAASPPPPTTASALSGTSLGSTSPPLLPVSTMPRLIRRVSGAGAPLSASSTSLAGGGGDTAPTSSAAVPTSPSGSWLVSGGGSAQSPHVYVVGDDGEETGGQEGLPRKGRGGSSASMVR